MVSTIFALTYLELVLFAWLIPVVKEAIFCLKISRLSKEFELGNDIKLSENYFPVPDRSTTGAFDF